MAVALRIPTCNIMVCEDITVNDDSKVYIRNPFTGVSGKSIKKFYTYTVIQGIPKGKITFKLQITRSNGEIIKETDENTVVVEENIVRAKTQWLNINFNEHGEHMICALIKCNNEFDIVGSAYIYIM